MSGQTNIYALDFNLHCEVCYMSDINRGNNKEIQRGTRNGRDWHSRGQGQARRWLSDAPLKGRASVPQTANRHAQQPEATITIPPPEAQAVRRRMNLMASVSRSSGLQKDGDDLKNYQIQEQYRNFIEEKLDDVLTHHPWRVSESEKEKRQRIDSQENVLILFRKLREGIASSGRHDLFALEVYELSLYLAVIFESPKQAISIIASLFIQPDTAHSTTLQSPSKHSTLISLLHHLVTSYPSQSTYSQHRTQTMLSKQSRASIWLESLTRSLRMRNYAKFESLSRKNSVLEAIKPSSTTGDENEHQSHSNSDLGLRALLFLVDLLRRKVGDGAWDTIRSAYREISCGPASMETNTWLRRSLCLDSVVLDDSSSEIESWLEEKIPLGHVRRKEGVEGRWIICKVR